MLREMSSPLYCAPHVSNHHNIEEQFTNLLFHSIRCSLSQYNSLGELDTAQPDGGWRHIPDA
jgi:hypothetical protein